jgi:hypothetical protein
VEEFLDGEEASFFALLDGPNAVALASAQDHKAVGDGDTGGRPRALSRGRVVRSRRLRFAHLGRLVVGPALGPVDPGPKLWSDPPKPVQKRPPAR